MSTNQIRVPDIGDFKDVPIIEVHVAPGATIKVDDPLITLESDKATMEVPAPQAGTVREVRVKSGDRVTMGDLIVVMEGVGAPAVPPKERITEAAAPSPGGGMPGYGSPSDANWSRAAHVVAATVACGGDSGDPEQSPSSK